MARVTESSFQITLPSNVSQEIYPSNRANSYKTRLAKPLQLNEDEDWEVSLVDMQFPSACDNIVQDTELIILIGADRTRVSEWKLKPQAKSMYPFPIVDYLDFVTDSFIGTEGFQSRPLFYQRIVIRRGRKPSALEFGNAIAEEVQKALILKNIWDTIPDFKFQLDPKTNLGKFTYYGSGIFWLCSLGEYPFRQIFKMAPELLYHPWQSAHCLNVYNFSKPSQAAIMLDNLSSMYVYSDLIKYQLVGDSEAPLLGVVPLLNDASQAQQVYYSFNPPYYIPLAKKYFDSIEININTDWGESFPFSDFDKAKVICRLHFRRKTY